MNWLIEDDTAKWSTPQIHTSAYSLPHFDALGHPQIDTSAYSRFHFDALGHPPNRYITYKSNILLQIKFIFDDMQDSYESQTGDIPQFCAHMYYYHE